MVIATSVVVVGTSGVVAGALVVVGDSMVVGTSVVVVRTSVVAVGVSMFVPLGVASGILQIYLCFWLLHCLCLLQSPRL